MDHQKPDIGHAASRKPELANKSCGVSNVVTLSKPLYNIKEGTLSGFDKVLEASGLIIFIYQIIIRSS